MGNRTSIHYIIVFCQNDSSRSSNVKRGTIEVLESVCLRSLGLLTLPLNGKPTIEHFFNRAYCIFGYLVQVKLWNAGRCHEMTGAEPEKEFYHCLNPVAERKNVGTKEEHVLLSPDQLLQILQEKVRTKYIFGFVDSN